MSSKMSNLSRSFLNELEQKNDTHDLLHSILEYLEEKNDPEPGEMRLVSDIYQYLEKLSILKENMKRYVINEYDSVNPGNKLSQLLEDIDKFKVY
jgi:hypothetical protein